MAGLANRMGCVGYSYHGSNDRSHNIARVKGASVTIFLKEAIKGFVNPRHSNAKNSKTLFITWLAILAVVVLAFPYKGNAADLEYSILLRRIETQGAQIASLQSQLASLNQGTQQVACDNCRQEVFCCKDPNWIAGYEMTILRPYLSNRTIGGASWDNQHGVGHRFIVGRDGGAGIGAARLTGCTTTVTGLSTCLRVRNSPAFTSTWTLLMLKPR